MSRLYLLAACLLGLAACNTQRMVCPAYQSSFIFDKEAVLLAYRNYRERHSAEPVQQASPLNDSSTHGH